MNPWPLLIAIMPDRKTKRGHAPIPWALLWRAVARSEATGA